MKTIMCVCRGVSSIMQHRFTGEEDLGKTTRKVHVKQQDPREVAEKAAYRTAEGYLYLTGRAIAKLLREAGAAHKQRGSRKSLKFVIPYAVTVVEDQIVLTDDEGTPLTEYEIDTRPVVNPSTKGRVLAHRPIIHRWNIEFTLEIDEEFIDPAMVYQLIAEGGQRLGVGDFRLEKGGSFGKFQIVSWKELGQKTPVVEIPITASDPPIVKRKRAA